MHLRILKKIIPACLALVFATQLQAQLPSGLSGQNAEENNPQTNRQPAPTPQITADSPFLGSVAEGKATSDVLSISILDALDRGLKHNLGLLLGGQGTRAARGAKLVALSDLLPHLTGRVAETSQQTNLAALGFPGIRRILWRTLTRVSVV